MKPNLIRWGTVIGAFPRILRYRKILGETNTYFDRLRLVNQALGPEWIFRLVDTVGMHAIKANRLSWYKFYVEDINGLHCPLDPGAPETEAYLGRSFSDMDMAFYAGMGFDGYHLALETSRKICFQNKHLDLDGRYRLYLSSELKEQLGLYDAQHFIPKEDYYTAYGAALTSLFDQIDRIMQTDQVPEDVIERTMAGCLILLCGGHHGCKARITKEDMEFQAQMESLIIFNHAKNIFVGDTSLPEPEMLSIA